MSRRGGVIDKESLSLLTETRVRKKWGLTANGIGFVWRVIKKYLGIKLIRQWDY